MDDLSFGQWLQRERKLRRLTQVELGDVAGCSPAAIRKIEADERRPSREVAGGIATALGVPEAQRATFVRFARGDSRPFSLDEPSPAPRGTVSQPWQPPHRPRHNLPVPPTPLIGRERESADIIARLRRPNVRLLTLLGPGGTGKTRLGLQAAMALLPDYAAGVWFIDLVPLTDPALVVPAIAQALGVITSGERPVLETLLTVLRLEPHLLLLDNVEHVVAAATEVAQLLAACPTLRVLATSRAPLRIAAEHTFPVAPLALPDPAAPDVLAEVARSEAGALFLARATAAQADVPLTTATALAIAALCARLDGLPLAIELAAARSTVFAPEALLARLAQRVDLLSGGPRDAPARQQTLQATIAWSVQLLSPAEQRVFARLGVFAGGWTLEAAEAIGGEADAGLVLRPSWIGRLMNRRDARVKYAK